MISGGIPEALDQPQTACALACVSNRAHATPSTRHYARRASNNHKCICESTAGSVGGVGTPLRTSRLTLQPCNALGATIAIRTNFVRTLGPTTPNRRPDPPRALLGWQLLVVRSTLACLRSSRNRPPLVPAQSSQNPWHSPSVSRQRSCHPPNHPHRPLSPSAPLSRCRSEACWMTRCCVLSPRMGLTWSTGCSAVTFAWSTPCGLCSSQPPTASSAGKSLKPSKPRAPHPRRSSLPRPPCGC